MEGPHRDVRSPLENGTTLELAAHTAVLAISRSRLPLCPPLRRAFIELYCLSFHPDADHRLDLLRRGMTRFRGAQLTDGVDAMHLVLVQLLGVRGGLTGAAT